MILDLFTLDNCVALVTGASRGLGQAMALGLAEAGADIACVSRSGDDRSSTESPSAAGECLKNSRGSRSIWLPTRRTTCTAASFPSTAGGWHDKW